MKLTDLPQNVLDDLRSCCQLPTLTFGERVGLQKTVSLVDQL
jgi:hypothetical protein